MRHLSPILSLLCLIASVAGYAQTAVPNWENPQTIAINKQPYHATLQLPSREKECKEIITIDGRWFFHWSPCPGEHPAGFWRTDYDVSQWYYGEEDLGPLHPHEVVRGRFVNVSISLNVHGVGGTDTWGKRTLPQYTIDANQPLHFGFVLSRR